MSADTNPAGPPTLLTLRPKSRTRNAHHVPRRQSQRRHQRLPLSAHGSLRPRHERDERRRRRCALMMPEREVDLLIAGAGPAGMTAALVASLEGLDVLLCEK